MKSEIIAKLEELLKSEDVSAVAPQIKSIQKEYEEAFAREMEKAKEDFIHNGGKANEFVYTRTPEDEKLIFLFGKFARLQKSKKEKQENEQDKNYEIKMSIIRDIGDLSKLEVNISGAIKKLHELQAKFKDTGPVPSAKHKEVLAEYNKVVDAFYFGLNLYKASQEVDLKKNFDAKTEIIEKIKKQLASDNLKEVERSMKVLRGEWEAIGPVPQEKWLALKEEFRMLNEQVSSRLSEYYGQQKEQLSQNLEAKKKLVEKARNLVVTWPRNEKEWEQKTKALLDIQNEYKEAGRTEQKAGDEVWKEFRGVCDTFFDKKKEFFEQAKGKYDEAKQKKQKLIEEASELKDSTDWQRTSEKLMNLQQQWKKLPNAHPRDEHKLYESFRAQCNHFFEAKRLAFAGQNAALEQNVGAKEELIRRLEAFGAGADAQETGKALKEFARQWQESGQVPPAERKRLNDTFYGKLEELYASLAGSEEEKQLIKYRLKIERFENSAEAQDLLRKESDFIRKQVNEIQHHLNTFENNMANFKSSSKTKSPLMIEMENKIAAEKAKVEEWKRKQKLVKEALDKLSRPQGAAQEG
jgi:hypothetical protein